MTDESQTADDWRRIDVGKSGNQCVGEIESPKTVGQLAQQICDFGDNWPHDLLCDRITRFVEDVINGKR